MASTYRLRAANLARAFEPPSPGEEQLARTLAYSGGSPSISERQSWRASLPVLGRDLVDAGLGHVEVLLEHRLPLSRTGATPCSRAHNSRCKPVGAPGAPYRGVPVGVGAAQYRLLVTFIAYIDETGDTGDPRLSGSSGCYALGCILLDLNTWPAAFDQVVAYRRQVRQSFGVPLRAELKANYLIRGGGPLRALALSPSQRNYIYRTHLQLLAGLPAEAFAIVVDKRRTGWQGATCFDGTWEMLLQRLERTCTKESRTMILAHDNGDNDAVRALVRRARRYMTAGNMGGAGSLRFKADRFLEDPVPKDSQHSYFIQMADLVAYAGWRSYQAPGRGVAAVVPQSMWSHVGAATKIQVNMLSRNGSQPGVVLRT